MSSMLRAKQTERRALDVSESRGDETKNLGAHKRPILRNSIAPSCAVSNLQSALALTAMATNHLVDYVAELGGRDAASACKAQALAQTARQLHEDVRALMAEEAREGGDGACAR